MTTPFCYPATPHQRRHGPQGYADYSSYRPWLRDEFEFRCVYCLARESWGRLSTTFALDHFLPVVLHPERLTDYVNLLYTCAVCNAAKGARLLPNPLMVLLSSLVRVEADGTIHTDDPETARVLAVLGLDSEPSAAFRMRWIRIIALAAVHDPELYQQLMGYPDELPDLRSLQPPGGNSRSDGIAQSALARRQRAELPAVY